jgi:chromate transporter
VALAGGLVPVTLGLTAASAVVVARAADGNRVAVGITVATAFMTYWIRVNPLWIFAVAALLGLSGAV